MLPIPHNIDIDSLREQKVSEVCYTSKGVTLHFGNDAHICINGYFAFRKGKQRHEFYRIQPVDSDYGLLSLLEAEVSEVYMSDKRDALTIEFTNDCRIELMGHMVDDTYTIHIHDNEAIV